MSHALEDVCTCGHTFGRHRGVPAGEPSPCKADDDSCPCASFKLAPPTDVSELAPDDRITANPPPPDANSDELRRALAHVANLCVDLIQRLDLGERRFAHVERRLDKIERHLGIAPAE